MGNRVIHISDAEAAGDFASLLDRVRAGDEVVIEHDAHPVAVLRPAPPAALRDAVNGAERERTEFRWLALNRERYAGRWVALDGDRLLAVGDSAREVYAAIANRRQTPLVTRVEPDDELNFAGWQSLTTTLTFRRSHDYSAQSGTGITIPVTLKAGRKSVRLLAKLDTGATHCIFERVYGEQLGLNIEGGHLETFRTATGEFQAYGHEVTIICFEWEFRSVVFFPAELEIHRNVLGRQGWLQQFRVALIDYDSVLHLSHYNQR